MLFAVCQRTSTDMQTWTVSVGSPDQSHQTSRLLKGHSDESIAVVVRTVRIWRREVLKRKRDSKVWMVAGINEGRKSEEGRRRRALTRSERIDSTGATATQVHQSERRS